MNGRRFRSSKWQPSINDVMFFVGVMAGLVACWFLHFWSH